MSEEVISASEQKKEDWMNSKWRPMMGWMYMLVCTCDFVIFPVLWSVLHAITKDGNITQWNPVTLQGAGLFHMAMGAVIGVAAFGRTQEKLAGANTNSATPSFGGSSSGFNSSPSGFTTPSAPATGFGAPASGFSFPAPSPAPSSFGSSGFGGAPSATTTPAVSKFGKVVPTQDDPPL